MNWLKKRKSSLSFKHIPHRFEKAIRYNTAQIELWKRFVSFAMQYLYINNQDEEKTKQIMERAMDNVGQHMQATEIWTEFIDFELALNHMGFVNLLGYTAVKTPLLDCEKILTKYDSKSNLFIRYLEIVETLYESMVDNMNSADFTVGDKYRSKYDELGKTNTSATLQANTTFFVLLPFPNLLGFLIILSCVFDIWTI